MKKPLALHPIPIAIFPILALYWVNMTMVTPRELAAPVLLSISFAVVLWAALRLVLRDAAKSAILASLALMLFYSYGHLFRYAGSHKYPCLLWGFIFACGLVLVARTHKRLDNLTRLLNGTSMLLVLFTAAASARGLAGPVGGPAAGVQVEPVTAAETGGSTGSGSVKHPDIYYIILDEYGRSDVLRELYGHDNDSFLDRLRSKGFFVAERGRTNYHTTSASLASSLNMDYIQNLIRRDSSDGLPLAADNGTLLWQSRVVSLLKERGYRIVTFSSSVAITDYMAADIRMEPPRAINEFQNILIGTTALPAAVRLLNNLGVVADFQYDRHRNLITYAFERLPEVGGGEVPVFVFAHVMACHPPFVFGQDGEPITPNYLFGLGDRGGGRRLSGIARAEYIDGYRRQLVHVNRLAERAIDEIIARSPDAVIVVQGDHGPRSGLDFASYENSDLVERMSILNAIRLPGSARPEREMRLYSTMTPVNTFRVIFNRLFDAKLELLKDRCYFSPDVRVFKFIDVTDILPPDAEG